MTPREVIPAEISEEVEAEVSTALNKMVADERRFSTPDPRIAKLEEALETIIWNCPHEGPGDWCGHDYCPCQTAFKALEA